MARTSGTAYRMRTDVVRKLMGTAGITSIDELARRMDVDRTTVSHAMNGRTVSLRTATGLQDAFPDWKFSELFERIEDADAA